MRANDQTSPTLRQRLERQHLSEQGNTALSSRHQVRRFGLRVIGALTRQVVRHPRPTSVERVLVIRPDHLGDLLFTVPALRLLRQRFPQAHIATLVGPWGKEVAEGFPWIDEILTCPFPGFTRKAKPSAWHPYRLLISTARRLCRHRFDMAIVLRSDHWWGAWLAAWANIPVRVGYATPDVRPFLTHPLEYVEGQHAVQQNLRLVDPEIDSAQAEDWPLQFSSSAADHAWAKEQLSRLSRPIVAIHPGAGAAIKRWREAAWSRVADALVERWQASIVITGGPGEVILGEAVAAKMRHKALVLAGKTSLGQLAALFAQCDLVLGPDSGPLHLAVAVGVPTVHLYGPADPSLFGPWGPAHRHRVIQSDWACAPCHRFDYPPEAVPLHGCVRDIQETEVLTAANELLSRTAPS
ncbi:MAG: glycosyltransferase family 9 protein [Anaerolineae bacterium]